MNFSIRYQDYSYAQTEENVKYYKSVERPLVFSKVIWRRADDPNDYWSWLERHTVMRMVVTEFGIRFALEMFLNLAPKSIDLRS